MQHGNMADIPIGRKNAIKNNRLQAFINDSEFRSTRSTSLPELGGKGPQQLLASTAAHPPTTAVAALSQRCAVPCSHHW